MPEPATGGQPPAPGGDGDEGHAGGGSGVGLPTGRVRARPPAGRLVAARPRYG
jgi:hypothetical protein